MQRHTAAPAADQVQEAVDAAEALDQRSAPLPRPFLVEQVGDAPVPAVLGEPELGAERVELGLVAVGARDNGPVLGKPLRNQRAQARRRPRRLQSHDRRGSSGP